MNLVMIRGGHHSVTSSFFPRNAEGAGEVERHRGFIGQHYAAGGAPPLIVSGHPVNDEELAQFLSDLSGHKVQLS